MEDSTPKGEHMNDKVFSDSLDFIERIEKEAYSIGYPRLILVSGGECSEHPNFVKFLDEIIERKFNPIMITNGSWLFNDELSDEILRPDRKFQIQITNDSRFYPIQVPLERVKDDKRVVFIPDLTGLITLGRASGKKKIMELGVPSKLSPSSFNFRSLTREYKCVEKAISHLRFLAITRGVGHCSPSISDDGTFHAGETRNCFPIGNIYSTSQEITENVMNMKCNKCGLVSNLPETHKRAIGEL